MIWTLVHIRTHIQQLIFYTEFFNSLARYTAKTLYKYGKVDHRGVPVATEYLVGKTAHPVIRHQYFTPLD